MSDRIYLENKKIAVKRATVGSALNLVATTGYYAAYAVVLARALAGALSIGTFTFLTGSFYRSRTYIERILSGFNDISEQALFLRDLFDFFAMQPRIRSAPGALPAPRPIRRGFEFRNVSFVYPGADRPVLKNVQFVLEPAEKLALIGGERRRQNHPGETAGAPVRPEWAVPSCWTVSICASTTWRTCAAKSA